MSFDWSEFVVPGECLPGGFAVRVVLRGVVPLAVMLAAVPLTLLKAAVMHVARCQPGWPPFYRALLSTLPLVLFIAFCFCASVSAGLFAAWSCVAYEVGTPRDAATPNLRSFLRADLSVECIDTDGTPPPTEARALPRGLHAPPPLRPQPALSLMVSASLRGGAANYTEIQLKSWIFIVVWPIGVPLLFLLVLLPSRKAIMQKRSTRLVRATAILHRGTQPVVELATLACAVC